MPGFYLVHDPSATPDLDANRFQAALTVASHDLNYRCEIPCVEPHLLLGWNKYPEYPLAYHQFEHSVCLLEGVVYDGQESELADFARRADRWPDRCARVAAWLRQWLPSCDAECVVVYAERGAGQGLVVANDTLGRLPVYWAREGNRLFIGREIKMLSLLMEEVRPDRLGVTEAIQFGYPLGPRTLLSGVSRLEQGSLISSNGPGGGIRHDRYHPWSFHGRKTSTRPASGDLKYAADEFATACRMRADRFPERPPVLLLSGGLDSRAVAGGLVRAGVPFRAVIFHGGEGYGAQERDIARAVAVHAGCPTDELLLRRPAPWHRQWSVDIRDGLVPATLAYLHQVYSFLRGRWQSTALVYTGDGGGQVMPPHRPFRSTHLRGDLCTALFARVSGFDSKFACRMTGLSPRQFARSISTHLEEYPEKEPIEKYMRYVVLERGFKWLVEGEDRIRAYMWMTTPFYARPFFETAIAVPFAWKHSNAWFRDFLNELSPRLSQIVYANTGALPGVPVRRRGNGAKAFLERFPLADLRLRDWHRRRGLRRTVAEELWPPGSVENCASSPLVGAAFDLEAVTQLMAKPVHARAYWQLSSLLWYFYRTDQTRRLVREEGSAFVATARG